MYYIKVCLSPDTVTEHIKSWASSGIRKLISHCHANIGIRILAGVNFTLGLFSTSSSLAFVERPTISVKDFYHLRIMCVRGRESLFVAMEI